MASEDINLNCDVAIIGGGPAGSTSASLLRKYAPDLSVSIFEKENFPREHVGESLLPPISTILNEMGVWEKVESAGFPIKLGATLLWGRSKELWDFDFIPPSQYKDEARPAKFEGFRRDTAFHVDRSVYDKILLDHARELGTDVHEGASVASVEREGDRITSLRLGNGKKVQAKYYVDASGNPAVIRRAMGVQAETPTALMNVAFWDYWQGADWTLRTGEHGTRILVMSVDYGWLWYIPVSRQRTSLGLVVPAKYYKESGLRPEELYRKAIADCPRICKAVENATSEGLFSATKDWSYVSERVTGENWFLVGESAGFADPILSAGLTITMTAARELAYTITELEIGRLDPTWLKDEYALRQTTQIRNHIRFADYWYSANEQLKDLKEYTARIADDVGLSLNPESAWRWIALGGFIDLHSAAGTGTYSLDFYRNSSEYLSDLKFESPLATSNIFEIDLSGSKEVAKALYEFGRVKRTKCFVRGTRVFPFVGVYKLLYDNLTDNRYLPDILNRIGEDVFSRRSDPQKRQLLLLQSLRGLEALVYDGWVKASRDPNLPMIDLKTQYAGMHWHQDQA